MKRILKFLVFSLIFVLVFSIIIAAITNYQKRQVAEVINDFYLRRNFEAVLEGECEKLGEIETKYKEIERKVNYACMNPFFKISLNENYSEYLEACNEVRDKNSKTKQALQRARAICK